MQGATEGGLTLRRASVRQGMWVSLGISPVLCATR